MKKVILVVLVFSFILVIFGKTISDNRPKSDYRAIQAIKQKKMYKELNDTNKKSSTIGKVSIAMYRYTFCSLVGEFCTDKPTTDNTYFNSSLMGKMSSLITLSYQNPPASGIAWITDSFQKAGFIPSSYAAEGIGFASIKPLINVWKIFRDISYLFIVLILVSIGFMIMFRMKLNPQTVISVENALPKIVVTLLLITFSFAIAGFLIDLMYMSILFVISILSHGDVYYKTAAIQNEFLNSGIGTIWKYVLPIQTPPIPLLREATLGNALGSLVPDAITELLKLISFSTILALGGWQAYHWTEMGSFKEVLNNINIFGNGVGSFPKTMIGTVSTIAIYLSLISMAVKGWSIILGVVIILTLLSLFFRIFFMLFRSYLQITLMIIFAPVVLLFEAIPGKSTFGYWIKGLIGDLMTFPIVIAMMLLGKILIETLSYPGDYWKAPFIGNINTEGFGVLIGAGLIFITPDLVKTAKDALGIKPFPVNIGLGTYLGGAGAVAGGGMGILQQFSTLNLGLQALGKEGIISKLRGNKTIPPASENPPKVASGETVTGQPA